MDEVYMIPQKDLKQLIQYYKGELTENALLNKAATLAAKKHVLLANPELPPALVNAQTKPLSQELTKLTKRIRQFPGGVGVGAPGGPARRRRRRSRGFGDGTRGTMVEAHDKRKSVDSQTSHYPCNQERQRSSHHSKIPIVKKGSPSTSRGDLQSRLEAVRERRKTWEKHLAESGFTKAKAKAKAKAKDLPEKWND